MFKAVTIFSLGMDPGGETLFIVLKEIEGEQMLPIWIGLLEATAIVT
jgi:bifunctional DNase/RNase